MCIRDRDYDGRVVATVGGRGEKKANRVQNRATMAKRHLGSAMKPLASYTPAIEMNLMTYSTLINDHPITLSNGSQWPPNYGSRPGVYSHPVSYTHLNASDIPDEFVQGCELVPHALQAIRGSIRIV